MGKNIIKISIIIIFLILVILFVFFTNKSNSGEADLKSKTEDEIAHLETKLLDIANKVNNISFSNYILTKTKVEDTEQDTNSQGSQGGNSSEQDNSQSQGGSSGGQESGEGSSQKSGSSSQGQSSGNKSQVTEKYEMERSSILTNKQTDIDWDYIKYNAELLYSNWSTTVIDLHSLNINNNDILNFGDTLNNLIIATKNEDKVQTLQIVSDLYSYIPKYAEQYSDDETTVNLEYTKYFIIDAYTLLEEDKWDDIDKQVENAKAYYSNIINSVNIEQKNQNKINKVYILLNELDNCINYKDKELFYIKYKALMENLEKI